MTIFEETHEYCERDITFFLKKKVYICCRQDMTKGAKIVMVLLESLAGTRHRVIRTRLKAEEKLEQICMDPYVRQPVLYKEIKKIRTLKSKS